MDFRNSIKRLKEHPWKIACGVMLASCFLVLLWPLKTPVVDKPFSTVLLDQNEELLGAVLAEDEIWRFPTSDSVPNRFVQALLTYEDTYFYQHPGINPIALWKALLANLKAGRVIRGGSTISMQLARLADGNQARTLLQKCKEMLMALRYEVHLSKEEILAAYCAHAPFGSNIEGLTAASYRYFGRSPRVLSWGEAAMLAVLPNQPSMIYPGRNTRQLKAKRDRLLERLLEQSVIDSLSYRLAVLEEIPDQQQPFPKIAQHLLFALNNKKGGIMYPSTLKKGAQKRVGALLDQYVEKLQSNKINNAAALVIDWRDQQIKAYVGNAQSGKKHGQSVDIITSVRSPGSLLKPFLYAYALHDGLIAPNQLLQDMPSFYQGFSPKNFDGAYYGAVQADNALARSLNIPFVNLLQNYGVAPFYNRLKAAGFQSLKQSPSHYGLSLILGGAEISPLEIAHLYTQLVRSIQYDSAKTSLQFLRNQTVESRPTELNPGAAWLTLEAMKKLERPSEELGWERFDGAQEIAWKTGTSFGFRDAWAVGINQRYLVVVWTGNADGEGRPGLIGVRTAAPLLFNIMELLKDGMSDFKTPAQALKTTRICKQSGYLAGKHCTTQETIFINKSHKKRQSCPYHKLFYLTENQHQRVNSSCYPLYKAVRKTYFELPPAVAYFYKQYHADYEELPPWKAGCGLNTANPIEMIYPRKNTAIMIPNELDGSAGRAIFELAHQSKYTQVFWYVDEQFLGKTQGDHQMAIPKLSLGSHQLFVSDAEGNYLRQNFQIVE